MISRSFVSSAKPDEQRGLCGNDSCAAANQLLRSIDKAGVAVWNNELKKFKRNGTSKDDDNNQAEVPAITDREQKAQLRKRADVLKQNNGGGFVCREFRPEVSRR
jgi:hypothetical protein